MNISQMKKILLVFLFPLSVIAQSSDWQQIQEVLNAQSEAWNRGNIEEYMQGYWKSSDLKFIGSNGMTKGWQETLERYQKSYPTTEKMGKLKFEILSHQPLSDDHYLVIGKWNLARKTDELNGHFTLIWKKINNQWVIIADHSS
jgi:ketosteroid isomerase-like protein